jgi:hypothetical protein
MNAEALGDCFELKPVGCRIVSSILDIVHFGLFRFIQCIQLGEGLLALFRIVPNFDPICFVGGTSLNNVDDVLRWVGIGRTRRSIAREVI